MSVPLEELYRELDEKRRIAREGGGKDKAEKQKAKGKLLARERVEKLFDPGTFEELQWLATARPTITGFPVHRVYGDGVIVGFGRIDGRLVYAFVQDFTVMGGSIGEVHAEKIANVIKMAMEVGVPVIGIFDSGGARIQEGVAALHGVGKIFKAIIDASGVIPQIAIMAGPCAGGAAYAPALMDFVIAVDRTSYMFVTGPEVVKEVTGEDVDFETLGGAKVHSTKSGVAHFRVKDEEEAFRVVRRLLSYLPDNYASMPPVEECREDPEKLVPELDTILPEDRARPYDIKEVLNRVFDKGSILEVWAEWAPNIVTAFARIGGYPVCVIANQPAYMAGVIDIDASCKAARFIRFCDCFNIPIVMFVDVPGYMPGTDQEHGGIIRHGAKMLYAYAEATVPKITVILRKAYGGAYISMGSKALGADIVFAWPTAEIAVLGAEAAVKILYRHEIALGGEETFRRLVETFRAKFMNPYHAAELGLIDDVIKPCETRRKLYRALMALLPKRVQRIPKKHGNIPL